MSADSFSFSLDELQDKINEVDLYVSRAARKLKMYEEGCLELPNTLLDQLAHLHGLFRFAGFVIDEIREDRQKEHLLRTMLEKIDRHPAPQAADLTG